jgi:hypothetical protein
MQTKFKHYFVEGKHYFVEMNEFAFKREKEKDSARAGL